MVVRCRGHLFTGHPRRYPKFRVLVSGRREVAWQGVEKQKGCRKYRSPAFAKTLAIRETLVKQDFAKYFDGVKYDFATRVFFFSLSLYIVTKYLLFIRIRKTPRNKRISNSLKYHELFKRLYDTERRNRFLAPS